MRSTELPPLPESISGHFAGVHGGRLIVAGGTYWDKPKWEGGEKRWTPSIYTLGPVETEWRKSGEQLEVLSYGGSATTGAGLVCVGGQTESAASTSVRLLWWEGSRIRQAHELQQLGDTCAPRGVLADPERHVLCDGQVREQRDVLVLPGLIAMVSGTVQAVQHTKELARILAMPRRAWTDPDMADLARDMTEAIRRPGGTMSLRPMQALALFELGTLGGLFGPMRVGVGKTLVSLLAPYVTEARRPLLLLPAKLVEKTIRERKELSRHWPVPVHLRIVSYELLGRTQSAALLENYAPDLILADEAHKLKNTKASVTRRVSRYMKTHPDTPFAALSGTITKRSPEGLRARSPLVSPVPVLSHSEFLDRAGRMGGRTGRKARGNTNRSRGLAPVLQPGGKGPGPGRSDACGPEGLPV